MAAPARSRVTSAGAEPAPSPLSSSNATNVPPPRGVTAAALTRGLSTAMRFIGPATMLLVLLVIGETAVVVAGDGGTVPVWPVVALWTPVFLASLALAVMPSRLTMITVMVVGATAGTAYVVVTLPFAAQAGPQGTYLVEALAVAITFVGALRPRALDGVLWIGIGVIIGTGALAAGYALADVPLQLSPDRAIDAAIMALAFVMVAIGWRRRSGTLPAFRQIDRDARLADEARRRERAAAALVHDTVLSSLTVIGRPGVELDERVRSRIEADLQKFAEARASRTGSTPAIPREGSLAEWLLELIEEYRWHGLSVDITGLDVILLADAVEPDIAVALQSATEAALENVRRHARARTVELTVGGDDERVTILIVDDGVGFDTSDVPVERLGIRESIEGRLDRVGGTARVWSSDSGTTVLLSAPRRVRGSAP